jgi:hypothetical protein
MWHLQRRQLPSPWLGLIAQSTWCDAGRGTKHRSSSATSSEVVDLLHLNNENLGV